MGHKRCRTAYCGGWHKVGLDTVELVMAYEEEFGIEIPDIDAEKICTVGQMFEYVKKRLQSTPPAACLSQRIFHKLRKALIQNYGMSRAAITIDTRLKDVLEEKELAEGWPFMEIFAELKMPPITKTGFWHWVKTSPEKLTVRELITRLLQLNFHALPHQSTSDEDIWTRVVDVVVRQANVRRDEVTYEASYTRDLGLD